MSLQTAPEGLNEIREMIAELDKCLLMGFVSGQSDILPVLARIFNGTPLSQRLDEAVLAIQSQEFQESHFLAIAAARSALQGSAYQLLQSHLKSTLGRNLPEESPVFAKPEQHLPILDSLRHWLMELAMTGFARLERSTVMDFLPTLMQMRSDSRLMSLTVLLTGFVNELITSIPAKDSKSLPILRWADLWSSAMIAALGLPAAAEAIPVSGVFYPLGMELRQTSHVATLIAYGLLEEGDTMRWLRQSWSSYKVDAVRGSEIWLLFPQAQQFLDSLASGKALIFKDMPMLPTGDLLWCAENATNGKKYQALKVAEEFFAPNAPLQMTAFPSLQRHPVQLAEPVFIRDYELKEDALHLQDGTILPIDTRSELQNIELPLEALSGTTKLFGLLRWDAGCWSIKPLSVEDSAKAFHFVGKSGLAILKKPPKSSSFETLKERSSKLLRKGGVRRETSN